MHPKKEFSLKRLKFYGKSRHCTNNSKRVYAYSKTTSASYLSFHVINLFTKDCAAG